MIRSLRAVLLCTGMAISVPFWSAPVAAQEDAGAYLAGRSASNANDFETAAGFFARSLMADPTNPALLEGALASYVGTGDMSRAAYIADNMIDLGLGSQLAYMASMSQQAKQGDWDALLNAQEAGQSIGPLVDGMARAWAHIGRGQMTAGIEAFDEMIEAEDGSRSFALYFKSLALASVGDYEGADAILGMSPMQGMQRTRRSTLAHAQVLSQLERNADAVALIDAVFGERVDAKVADMRTRLSNGETVPFTYVNSPAEGFAETLYSVAQILDGETDDFNTLIYARLAIDLDPTHTDATLLTARLLEQMGRFELADATYRQIAPTDPAYSEAELGRAKALIHADRREAAVEVLQALIRRNPEQAMVHATLGDTLRQLDRMRDANDAYTQALDLFPADSNVRWFVLYSRAITHHDLDNWPAAEADFRASLALNPDEARVLNYLGYSLVERQEKMDEALDMIERAAASRPDSGAIVDSLGWVLYRMGRYDEAVGHMEHAASLMPSDAVVNDHLGDTYWAVGRYTEAQFQWNRALSFDPAEEDAARIRRKIDVGLDVVLAEEGSDPLQVANGNGG